MPFASGQVRSNQTTHEGLDLFRSRQIGDQDFLTVFTNADAALAFADQVLGIRGAYVRAAQSLWVTAAGEFAPVLCCTVFASSAGARSSLIGRFVCKIRVRQLSHRHVELARHTDPQGALSGKIAQLARTDVVLIRTPLSGE